MFLPHEKKRLNVSLLFFLKISLLLICITIPDEKFKLANKAGKGQKWPSLVIEKSMTSDKWKATKHDEINNATIIDRIQILCSLICLFTTSY